MHLMRSEQYDSPCVVADSADNADDVIEQCRTVGATRTVDGEEFVVQLRPEIGPELWTAESLHASLRQPPLGLTPYQPKPTVLTGYTANPDSPDEWANCVTIEATDGETATGGQVPLVKIETNYKPHGRLGNEYPVNLTLSDAVKAAAALLAAVVDSLQKDNLAGRECVGLLNNLHEVDDELISVRAQLTADLEIALGIRVLDNITPPSTAVPDNITPPSTAVPDYNPTAVDVTDESR